MNASPPAAMRQAVGVTSQTETTMQDFSFSRLLAKKDTARRLGISIRTLERQIEAGDGPAIVRIGSRILFPEDALAAWVAAHTEQPHAA